MVKRRTVLKLLAASGLARWLLRQGSVDADTQVRSFFVAGSRFNALPEVRPGDPVVIRPESWRGEPCYGVYTEAGQRIGFVPRSLVSRFTPDPRAGWRVAAVDRHAVPWKRYRVGAFV